jgi:RimJ/RimL family protein N-acetyltransferase
MNILDAYDLTESLRDAGELAGCSHHTVKHYVERRAAAGELDKAVARPQLIDDYLAKVEEWVERSHGKVRADVAHEKLLTLGYAGSERTTRRAVATVKTAYRAGRVRVHRPWITEPGMWTGVRLRRRPGRRRGEDGAVRGLAGLVAVPGRAPDPRQDDAERVCRPRRHVPATGRGADLRARHWAVLTGPRHLSAYSVQFTPMTVTPERRSLRNAVVQLDPLQPDDAPDLFSALDDARVWAGGWGGGPAARPDEPEGMGVVVAKLIAGGYPWAVRDAIDGSLVGTASLLDVDIANERCMFGGAAYSPDVWGSPVNAATNLALLGYAFEDCSFGRVMLQTDVLNTRMSAAIEKMGATSEGVLRRHKRRADGTFRDSAVFSIIADEWPEVRDRLQARLGAEPESA